MRKRLKHYTTVVRKLAQGTHLLVTPIKKISRKGERDRDDAAVGRKFALVKAVSRRQNRLAKEGAADTRVTGTNLL